MHNNFRAIARHAERLGGRGAVSAKGLKLYREIAVAVQGYTASPYYADMLYALERCAPHATQDREGLALCIKAVCTALETPPQNDSRCDRERIKSILGALVDKL